jgi:hypothetical protein
MKAAAVPVGMSWMWTLAFVAPRGSLADARLRGDARGRAGGICEELAKEVRSVSGGKADNSRDHRSVARAAIR